MAFWKNLFGSGSKPAEPAEPEVAAEEVYKGFTIRAEPFQADGQYQLAGSISREIDGVMKSHRFVRADKAASKDDVAAMALMKGRRIVDEQGERIFD